MPKLDRQIENTHISILQKIHNDSFHDKNASENKWPSHIPNVGHLLPFRINRTYMHRLHKMRGLGRVSPAPSCMSVIFHLCRQKSTDQMPSDLRLLMTSLLHERDVGHQMTWDGQPWHLGSGVFGSVHLGRLVSSGQCVVVKAYQDIGLRHIEKEVQIQR